MRYPEVTIIVGTGRSGTTYLTRMFFASMDMGMSSEPRSIASLYRKIGRFGDLKKKANLQRLVETVYADKLLTHLAVRRKIPVTIDELWERVQEPTYRGVMYAMLQLVADKRGKSRLAYKDPLDLINMPVLAEIFPTARFVHIIRDGRDVAASMLKFKWGNTNLFAGGRFWAERVRIGQADGSRLAERYFELRLEDLVLDTEQTATAVGQFVNQGRNPEQVTDLVARVNRTKRVDAIYQWRDKLTASERRLCEAGAGEMLGRCGYEVASTAQLSLVKQGFYLGADFCQRSMNRVTRGKVRWSKN